MIKTSLIIDTKVRNRGFILQHPSELRPRSNHRELERVFDSVIEPYSSKLPRKPEYAILGTTAFERRYIFSLYVKDPRDIFTIQPAFVRDITAAWEKARQR